MRKHIELLESIAFSFPKKSTKTNEDAVLPAVVTRDSVFIALADGVGGSIGGGKASNIAVSTVREEISANPEISLREIYSKVSENINIQAEFQSNHNMATTLVVCKITRDGVEIANVGDSRAYYALDKSLIRLTRDHTEKQKLIDTGVFSSSELKGHSSGSRLTNSMRAGRDYKLDTAEYDFAKGSILLMSDGLYNYFEGSRIIGNSGADDLLLICSNLKKKVLKKGPNDDFSLVAVKFIRA